VGFRVACVAVARVAVARVAVARVVVARGAVARVAMALIVAALAVAVLAPTDAADDITVAARVDRSVVSVNDRVTLTITVEGTMRQVPQPKLPSLDDFSVRSSGSSSNFSMVNGKISTSKTWNYALYPRSTGTFAIGSAEVDFEGTVYRTDPIEVKVVEGQAPQRQQAPQQRPSTGADGQGRDVFITTKVDRLRAHVDQQITLSFKFYRRVNLYQQPRYEPPDLTGFWVEDFPEQDEYYEDVDGVRYHVIEIRTALFGASAGEATIGPATLSYRTEGAPFTFFSRPGSQRTLTTNPIAVEILPLPADGRPPNFGGAVGTYRVRATLDPTAVKALEPSTLTVRISGTGNIRTIPEPAIPDLPEFKIYESGTSTSFDKGNWRVGGVKTYEYVVVPQTSGEKTIPGVVLSFFDPAAGEYATASSPDLTLAVAPGAAGEEETYLPPRARIARVGRDVRYIHEPAGELVASARPLHSRPWFLALQLIPVASLGAVWMSQRRRDRFARDQGLARYVQAPGRARRELKEARARISAGDRSGACAAITRAITGFIGDRLNVEAQGMTQGELEAALGGVAPDELIARVRRLLGDCDLGRFAGGGDAVEGARLLDEAQACLNALEKTYVKRRR